METLASVQPTQCPVDFLPRAGKPSGQPTGSDENQGGLTPGFSVANLHSVGALVLHGESVHDHLNKARRFVAFNSVFLEATVEVGNQRYSETPPGLSLTLTVASATSS